MINDQHEWLDVVDSDDQVIGAATRADIHREGLRHRAVHIVVLNTAGDVFLQLRSNQKDNDPGLWDTSVAGHVDSGETYLECAVRELQEELGVKVSEADLQPHFFMQARPETGMEFAWVYTLQHEGPFEPDPDEIDDTQWVPPATLEAWIATEPETLTRVFRLLWSQLNSGDSP